MNVGIGARRFLVFCAVISTSFGHLAHATSFVERPFPESVHDAPVIARGKIGMSYADWAIGSDGRKRIYTFWEFLPAESIKGELASSSRVMIRELGGEKDGVGLHISGTARFDRGEDVVVFLGPPNLDGTQDVHGMMMGKYDIEKDEQGNEYLVGAGVNGLSDDGDEARDPRDKERQGDTTPMKKWTLSALRNLVHSQAAAQSTQLGANPSPAKSPAIAGSTLSSQADSNTSRSAAPQLQPSTSGEETGSSRAPWIWSLGALGTIVCVSFLALRRK